MSSKPSHASDTATRNAITKIKNGCHPDTAVFQYSVKLPQQFNDDVTANRIFTKMQADLCKHLSRHNGLRTPKYVAVKQSNTPRQTFHVALFVEQPTLAITHELVSEKANYITNGKVSKENWEPYQQRDLMAILAESPFVHVLNTIKNVDDFNADDDNFIGNRLNPTHCRKTLFVSRIKK